jgi:hypothetical protein
VRAAAVTSLASFGAAVPALRTSVTTLLRRALYDNDDEVRDRAALHLHQLGGGWPAVARMLARWVSAMFVDVACPARLPASTEVCAAVEWEIAIRPLWRPCVCSPPHPSIPLAPLLLPAGAVGPTSAAPRLQVHYPNLERSLKEYLAAGPHELPFDIAAVPKAPAAQQKQQGGGAAGPVGFSPLKKTANELYEEQLMQVGQGRGRAPDLHRLVRVRLCADACPELAPGGAGYRDAS